MGNTDPKELTKDTGVDAMRRRFLCVAIALTLAFIWGHSMIPADLSTEESSYFVNLINGFLSSFPISAGGGFSVTDHMVRKTAHFLEYALLGGEVCLLSILTIYQGEEKKPKTVSTDTVLAKNARTHGSEGGQGALVPWPRAYIIWVGAPLIDEFIQYFTPGRACMWQDVLLDMTGFAAGFLFLRECPVLWKRNKK